MYPELSSLANYATVAVSLFVVLYLYAKYKQTYWSRRGVYSPPAHWFFGHFKDAVMLRAAAPTVLGDLHQLAERRPVLGVYILQKPFLLLRSPEVIKRILIKDFALFSNRHFASKRKTDVIGSANLFAIDNPQWKYLRVKLSTVFTTGKQKRLFGLMLECADQMKQHLAGKVTGDGLVGLDARRVSNKYTTDVISSLTFGIRTNSFETPEPDFYVRSRTLFEQSFLNTLQVFANFFFPKLNDLTGATFLGEQTSYFRKIFWESVTSREKSGQKRGDIIDMLVELKNEKQSPEFQFSGDYLFAQTVIFFVAGLETSSVTMAFALLELARNPDLQKKVREEIREKLGNQEIAYEQVSQMTYLQQVVSETLRLYPPAPIIDRYALNDYKIPDTDIVIEKGTVVYVALTGLHKDPEFYPDPLKFDPDRFSESRKQEIKPCTYMPFGDGPRICIGQRIGSLQTMVGLVTILRDYEVSINPNHKTEISKRSIFLAPSNGVQLYFKKSSVINI